MARYKAEAAGAAALAICEALLLSLRDRKVLPEPEIVGLLQDAAAGHVCHPDYDEAEFHRAVVQLVEAIVLGNRQAHLR